VQRYTLLWTKLVVDHDDFYLGAIGQVGGLVYASLLAMSAATHIFAGKYVPAARCGLIGRTVASHSVELLGQSHTLRIVDRGNGEFSLVLCSNCTRKSWS
jgi:hypothetical protein